MPAAGASQTAPKLRELVPVLALVLALALVLVPALEREPGRPVSVAVALFVVLAPCQPWPSPSPSLAHRHVLQPRPCRCFVTPSGHPLPPSWASRFPLQAWTPPWAWAWAWRGGHPEVAYCSGHGAPRNQVEHAWTQACAVNVESHQILPSLAGCCGWRMLCAAAQACGREQRTGVACVVPSPGVQHVHAAENCAPRLAQELVPVPVLVLVLVLVLVPVPVLVQVQVQVLVQVLVLAAVKVAVKVELATKVVTPHAPRC